jgi:signal transduction histidine kinase
VAARRWALVAVGVVLAVAVEWSAYEAGDLELVVADGVVGVVLIGCGAVAWERRGASRTGPLMVLAGLTWFAGTAASFALFWHRGPLVHLHLSYPTGRLRRRLAAVTVVVAYIDAVVAPVARNDVVTVGLAVLVAAAAVEVFARTSGPARRAGRPALVAAIAYSGVLAAVALLRLADSGADWDVVVLAYDAVVVTVAIILLVDLLSGRWAEATVADLVIGLGGGGELGTLRGQLARALGDPSVVVGYWIDGRGGYVDDRGEAVDLADPGRNRTVTTIDDEGQHVAVLVHDATVVDDRRLVAAVAAAARIAVSNARMQAEAHLRVDELAASRRRIVESADEQRRRLERELSDRADRRLEAVLQLLDDARREADDEHGRSLDALAAEVRGARAELHDVAQGIRPAELSEGGLAAAVPVLARRAHVPVDVAVDVGRLPPAVEAALYFVCAEALTNVAKHSGASQASLTVACGDSTVIAAIADDGAGGADPSRGTGLRGLADRVEALGGRFAVGVSPRGGTTVTAEVPVEGTLHQV